MHLDVIYSVYLYFSFIDSPHLEQPEVFLLLQTVINILLPPRIISTSRSKNFVLDASPAHCSTPGDTGKDLRREGLAESTSQAAYLGTRALETVGWCDISFFFKDVCTFYIFFSFNLFF